MKKKRSQKVESDLNEIGIFMFLTLVIFFGAVGIPTLINTSPSIGYEGIDFTPVTTYYQEAYAEQQTINILSKYYYEPILASAFLVIPTAIDNFPPEDPLQYFERKYSHGVQLEFGFIEFDTIQEFLTPNINNLDFLPPEINEIFNDIEPNQKIILKNTEDKIDSFIINKNLPNDIGIPIESIGQFLLFSNGIPLSWIDVIKLQPTPVSNDLFGLLPSADATEQFLWAGDDASGFEVIQVRQGGTGTTCPAITSPSSATTGTSSQVINWRDGSANGCYFPTYTMDRTTTPMQLLPRFFEDTLTTISFLFDIQIDSDTTMNSECRYFSISNSSLGNIDPRLNATGAYQALEDDAIALTMSGSIIRCINSNAQRPEIVGMSGGTTDYIGSMALNSSFYSFGFRPITDERASATEETVTHEAFIRWTFTNPTTSTAWQMQEHPKFDTSTLTEGKFEILDSKFSMNTAITDNTDKGQVVIFKEFNKTEIGGGIGFDTNAIITDLAQAELDAVFLSGQNSAPRDIFFSPNGTKMYMAGLVSDEINEYTLSTAWNIITKSFIQVISLTTDVSGANGVHFKDDGLKMYVSGASDDQVHEYDLSNAFDVSSASFLQAFTLEPQSTNGLFISSDGLHLYIPNGLDQNITRYDFGTAFDVSTLSFNQFLDISTDITNAQDVWFNPDGTLMFILEEDDGTKMNVVTYTLSTPYDLTTATFSKSKNFSVSVINLGFGIFFRNDGLKFYLMTDQAERLLQYDFAIVSGGGNENLPDIRVTGNLLAQSVTTDMWFRLEIKDGEYGMGSDVYFPQNKYDIYQGGGSLGVVHIQPQTTTVEPIDISITPNWSNSTGDIFTVFIGLDDNSTSGALSANITNFEFDNNIKHDFESINYLQYYEVSASSEADVGKSIGTTSEDGLEARDFYNQGLVNFTSVATSGVTGLALPTPSTPFGFTLQTLGYEAVQLDWGHDLLNVTNFKISRESPIDGGFQAINFTTELQTEFLDTNSTLSLLPNTQYNYEVCALNGDSSTCVTKSVTTPLEDDVWHVKEHDGGTGTELIGGADIDITTDGGTGDWLSITSTTASRGAEDGYLWKSFNIANTGIRDSDIEIYWDHDISLSPDTFQITVCESSNPTTSYNDTQWVGNSQLLCDNNIGGLKLQGATGTLSANEPIFSRFSLDWNAITQQYLTVYTTFDDDLIATEYQLDIKNFTWTNATSWDFTGLTVNYTNTNELPLHSVADFECNSARSDKTFKSSEDCDAGAFIATSTIHSELKSTEGTNDWQYREYNDGSLSNTVPFFEASIDSTGFMMESKQAPTDNEPDETGEMWFFKSFPSSNVIGNNVTIGWDGVVGVETGGMTTLVQIYNGTLDRWNGTDFLVRSELSTQNELIDSVAIGGTVPFTLLSSETVDIVPSESTVTVAIGLRDQSLSRDGTITIQNVTVGGTTYDFKGGTITEEVSGRNGGDRGLITPSQTFFTTPDAITDLTATPIGSQCDLAWTLPFRGSTAITGHRILSAVDGGGFIELVANTGTTTNSYSDLGLVIGSSYDYDVRAINSIGEASASNIANCIPVGTGVPDAPTGLTTTNQGNGDVLLDWDDTSDSSIVGYKIERKLGNEAFNIIVADTGTQTTQYTDTTTVLGTEYTYRIFAINTFGESLPSGESTIMTLNPPNMPTLSAVQSGSMITLTWTQPTSDGTINGYKIERRVNMGAFSVLIANTSNTLLTSDDSAVTKPNTYGYRVSAHDDIPSTGDISNVVDVVFGSHVTVQIREQDGSGFKGGGTVKVVNSTFSQTRTLDSNSNVVFDNLDTGNYNYIFTDLDNFILNKTFDNVFPDLNLVSTFTVNALVFDVNCPVTGGADVRIKLNYTQTLNITAYPSIPVCDSIDKVSWSTTWDGNAGTEPSQMVADFISPRFRVNADQFLVGVTPVTTTYSQTINRIISSNFDITTTSPVTINFDLFLGEAPAGGSPSPTGTGSSSISIPDPEVVFGLRLTGLSLLSRTHQFAEAGDVIQGSITVNWNGEENLIMKKIDVGEFSDIIRFTDFPPFPLDQNVLGIGEFADSTAEIPYTIILPQQCSEELGITQNCFKPELLTIPLKFTFGKGEQRYDASTDVFVDGRPIPIDIVQLQIILLFLVLVASAVFGGFIRNRLRRSNRRKATVKTKFKKRFDSS